MGSLSLLQGIFSTQGSNSHLLHCRQILYLLVHTFIQWMFTSAEEFQWRLRRIVTKIDKITPGCRGWVGYGRWGGRLLFAYLNVVKHVDGVPEKRSSLRPLWLWGYCDGNTVGCSGPSLFHPFPHLNKGSGMELPSWRLEVLRVCEVYLHSTFTHFQPFKFP